MNRFNIGEQVIGTQYRLGKQIKVEGTLKSEGFYFSSIDQGNNLVRVVHSDTVEINKNKIVSGILSDL